jgi:membrane fusion protein, adhesin transport system
MRNKADELSNSFRFQNRELLDNYVILALCDLDGVIRHVSTQLCNVFGYKPSDLIDKKYEFLIKKEAVELFKTQFYDIVLTKTLWKGEIKHATKNDELLWMDTIIQPLFNDQHEFIGFIFASNDITQEKKLKKINEENLLLKKYDKTLLDFMPSFSSAVLLRSSSALHKILWLMAFTVIFLIVWASFSKIDELVKAEGKIIPSDKIETISSFEGGIIDEVLVKEGDFVTKDQPLARLHDIAYTSEYEKNKIRLLELKAKKARLEAEAFGKLFVLDHEVMQDKPNIMTYEQSLYELNQKKFTAAQAAIKEKLIQKKNDLSDALGKEKLLQQNYELLAKEMSIKKELAQEGIVSKIDFMQQMRKFNDLEVDLKAVKGSIPTLQSAIKELDKNLEEAQFNFKKESQNTLTETNAEIDRLYEMLSSLQDKVERAVVLSPTEGYIKTIAIKTQGATIQAGKTFIEIVPKTDYFVSEVKVKPSDIGFLYVGQSAKVKLKPYDFSIYGGLDGNISYISADTIFDEKGKEEWYVVYVKTQTNYLDTKGKLKIKAGMTVETDILTGKRTIMDYILKPILKTKQSALTER